MNNRARITLFGLGIILFACVGITAVFILKMEYPYLFSDPSELVAHWLEQPTCKVPCWEKITPGETNFEEAKSLLFRNQMVKAIGKSNVPPDRGMLSVDMQGDSYNPNASIEFDNHNIAQSVKLLTWGQNLYLNDIVSLYGSPTSILIYEQETAGVDIDLLYPETGLVINLYSQDAEIMSGDDIRFTISPKNEVYGVSLYAPNLEYYYLFARQPLRQYDWKGFADYP